MFFCCFFLYVRMQTHKDLEEGWGLGGDVLYYSSVVLSERSWQHLWTY